MTGIEWTNETWNPTTGCDRVSAGCDNCYALTMASRLKGMGSAKYQRDGDPKTSGSGFGLTTHHDALDVPLHWRKPRRVFVNSMSDLFHKDVPDEFIARVFAVMAAAPQHTFQILTKRHGRMRSLLNSERWRDAVVDAIWERVDRDDPEGAGTGEPEHLRPIECREHWWPLRNVWLGVSAEDQQRADLRVPALLDTPAAVRFLSCEPLLGPVNLRVWPHLDPVEDGYHRIDWVICGGESGPSARPMDVEWVRDLREQCQAGGVPLFVKQMGSVWARENGWSGKGGLPEQWPDDLRIRRFLTAVTS